MAHLRCDEQLPDITAGWLRAHLRALEDKVAELEADQAERLAQLAQAAEQLRLDVHLRYQRELADLDDQVLDEERQVTGRFAETWQRLQEERARQRRLLSDLDGFWVDAESLACPVTEEPLVSSPTLGDSSYSPPNLAEPCWTTPPWMDEEPMSMTLY
jgi:hypothetical protein